MLFNSAPVNTLYVRANFKRTPYKNEIVTFRIVAHTYADFTSNNALMLVDTNPDVVDLQQVYEIADAMRGKANALNVVVKIPQPVRRKLLQRSIQK